MKEKKPKTNSPKKAARITIQSKVLAELKTIASQFAHDSAELIDELEKSSKKIAKKISQKLKGEPKPAKAVAKKERPAPAVNAAKKPVAKAKVVAPAKKPAAPAAKPEVKKVLVKPTGVKEEPVKSAKTEKK